MNSGNVHPSKKSARVKLSATLIMTLTMTLLSSAHAHLMVGQRGTLNFVGSGAFMVLSVPVSAFSGVDDNDDGTLSMIEFNHHREDITSAVISSARLLDEQGPRPMQGIMLAPSIPDNDLLGSAEYLVIMGRYALPQTDSPLTFKLDLFGVDKSDQSFSISVTRQSTNQTQTLILKPDVRAQPLFPSWWTTVTRFVHLETQHIFEEHDHPMYLLVSFALAILLIAATLVVAGYGHPKITIMSMLLRKPSSLRGSTYRNAKNVSRYAPPIQTNPDYHTIHRL